MVFGMCANCVIWSFVTFVKDVVAVGRGEERPDEVVAGARFEEITTEEKKTN